MDELNGWIKCQVWDYINKNNEAIINEFKKTIMIKWTRFFIYRLQLEYNISSEKKSWIVLRILHNKML